MCINQLLSYLTLDNSTKIATVLIAVFNAIFAIRVFYTKDRKEDRDKEKDRKLQLLKTLVLDHNLGHFYDVFDQILEELANLKGEDNLSDDLKQGISDKTDDLFILLRRKFYDLFIAIDVSLYDKLKTKVDNLQSHITTSIFDSGINLSHVPKFDEVISERISEVKTGIIKEIFSYRG